MSKIYENTDFKFWNACLLDILYLSFQRNFKCVQSIYIAYLIVYTLKYVQTLLKSLR